MIKKILLFCFMVPLSLYAQSTEEKAIKQVVLDLFDGMRTADTSKINQCFYFEDIDIYSGHVNENLKSSVIQTASLKAFLAQIATPHPEIYDERLGEYGLKIEENMASFHVDYYFYVDSTFSHCGVNFFQLFKSTNGWKIISLADTRRSVNCQVPETTW